MDTHRKAVGFCVARHVEAQAGGGDGFEVDGVEWVGIFLRVDVRYTVTMRLGSHVSMAGGLDQAVARASALGLDCFALFVRNQRQWASAPLREEAAAAFRAARRDSGLSPVVAHGSYLVNLAGEDPTRSRSIGAVAEELTRCSCLGIEYLVIHPGAHADLDEGIARIAAGIEEAFEAAEAAAPITTMLLLETTAGQGRCIGHRFEHLAAIRDACSATRRRCVGVCLDTAHVFASGYDLRTPAGYRAMMCEFDATVGRAQLRAIHLNDTLKPLGSCVDRHAHIGLGEIGLAGFEPILRDATLAEIPLILETPKGDDETGQPWDAVNAQTARRIAAGKAT